MTILSTFNLSLCFRFRRLVAALEAILGEMSIDRRRAMLRVTRLDFTSSLLAIRALPPVMALLGEEAVMWSFIAKRKLTMVELQLAVSIKIGSKDLRSARASFHPADIIRCSCGVLTEQGLKSWSFLDKINKSTKALMDSTLFPAGHEIVAMKLITFLSLNTSPSKAFMSRYMKGGDLHALAEYALYHWGDHAKLAPTEPVLDAACALLDSRTRSQTLVAIRLEVPAIDGTSPMRNVRTGIEEAQYFKFTILEECLRTMDAKAEALRLHSGSYDTGIGLLLYLG